MAITPEEAKKIQDAFGTPVLAKVDSSTVPIIDTQKPLDANELRSQWAQLPYEARDEMMRKAMKNGDSYILGSYPQDERDWQKFSGLKLEDSFIKNTPKFQNTTLSQGRVIDRKAVEEQFKREEDPYKKAELQSMLELTPKEMDPYEKIMKAEDAIKTNERLAQMKANEYANGVDYLVRMRANAASDGPTNVFNEFYKGFARATQQAGGAVFGALEMLSENDPYMTWLNDYAQTQADNARSQILKTPELNRSSSTKNFTEGGFSDPNYYANIMGSLLPHIAGALTASVAGGLVGGGAGAVVGASAYSYSMESGSLYNDLLGQGYSMEEARSAAAKYGVVAAALDSVIPAKVGGAVANTFTQGLLRQGIKQSAKQTISTMIKEFGKDVLIEASTEAAQEFAQNVTKSYFDKNQDIWENVVDSFVGGALGGGVFGAVGAGNQAVQNKSETVPEEMRNYSAENGYQGKEAQQAASKKVTPDVGSRLSSIVQSDSTNKSAKQGFAKLSEVEEGISASIRLAEVMKAKDPTDTVVQNIQEKAQQELDKINVQKQMLAKQYENGTKVDVVSMPEFTMSVGETIDGKFISHADLTLETGSEMLTNPTKYDTRAEAEIGMTQLVQEYIGEKLSTDSLSAADIENISKVNTELLSFVSQPNPQRMIRENRDVMLLAQDMKDYGKFEKAVRKNNLLPEGTDLAKFYERAQSKEGMYITAREARSVVEKYAKDMGVSTQFVERMTTPQGKQALGSFMRDERVIKLVTRGEEGMPDVEITTPYHEVGHAYFQTTMTPEERVNILQEIKNNNKNELTDKQAEEILVEDLRAYNDKKTLKALKKRIQPAYARLLDSIKEIVDKVLKWVSRSSEDKISQFYEDVLSMKRPSEKVEFDESIAKVQEEYYRNPKALTSKFFKHKEFTGKTDVSYNVVLNALKGAGLKEAERSLIENVLVNDFAGHSKINLAQLEDAIISELLPLEVVESDSYADYGASQVAMEDAQQITHIYDSPVKHGVVGHFSSSGVQGLFGHTRVWSKDGANYIAEIQSDFFQKGRDNTTRPTKEGVEEALQILEKYYGIESKPALSQDVISSMSTGNGGFLLYQALKKSSGDDWYNSTRDELLRQQELGEQLVKLTPYKNIWHERMIKEEIRLAALDGKKELYIPTPYTIAHIEQYVSTNGGLPYTLPAGHSRDVDLEAGQIIEMDGNEMIVLDAGSYAFDAVPYDMVKVENYEMVMDQEKQYIMEEIRSEIRSDTTIDDLPYSDLVGDFMQESRVTDLKSIVDDIDVEQKFEEYIDLNAWRTIEETFAESFEKTYRDGEKLYLVESGAIIEAFQQPRHYDVSSTSAEDFTLDDFEGAQKGVLTFYEKAVNPYFKKLRAGNVEQVTDDNGFTWLKTEIRPEDGEAVEAFRTAVPSEFLRGGYPDYVESTELTARERFDIPNLKKIGAGSDRVVFDLGDNVVKITKTSRGIAQNNSSGDYYAESQGLIPKTIEVGKNYIVKEKVSPPDANTKKMVKELSMLRLGRFFYSNSDRDKYYANVDKATALLEEYGYPGEGLRDYGDVLWGDLQRIKNWGTLNGKPMLLDEGSLNGDLVTNDTYQGRSMQDPDFKEMVVQSREAKKQFGDSDKNTMFREIQDDTAWTIPEKEEVKKSVDNALYEVSAQVEVAQAGMRIGVEDGTVAFDSTFPQWVSPDNRSKELLTRASEYLDGRFRIPPKNSPRLRSAVLDLYTEVARLSDGAINIQEIEDSFNKVSVKPIKKRLKYAVFATPITAEDLQMVQDISDNVAKYSEVYSVEEANDAITFLKEAYQRERELLSRTGSPFPAEVAQQLQAVEEYALAGIEDTITAETRVLARNTPNVDVALLIPSDIIKNSQNVDEMVAQAREYNPDLGATLYEMDRTELEQLYTSMQNIVTSRPINRLETVSDRLEKNAQAEKARNEAIVSRLTDARIKMVQMKEARAYKQTERNRVRNVARMINLVDRKRIKDLENEVTMSDKQYMKDIYKAQAKGANAASLETARIIKQKLRETRKHKELIGKIESLRSRVKASVKTGGRYYVDFARKLLEVFDEYDTSSLSNRSMEKLQNVYEMMYSNEKISDEMKEWYKANIARVSKKSLREMTYNELNDLYTTLSSLANKGAFELAQIQYFSEEEKQRRIALAIESTNNLDGKGRTGTTRADLSKGAFKEALSRTGLDVLTPVAVMDKFDGSRNFTGWNAMQIRSLQQGEQKWYKQLHMATEELKIRIQEIKPTFTAKEETFLSLVARSREEADGAVNNLLLQLGITDGIIPAQIEGLTLDQAEQIIDIIEEISDRYEISTQLKTIFEARTNKPFPIKKHYIAPLKYTNRVTDTTDADIEAMQNFADYGTEVGEGMAISRMEKVDLEVRTDLLTLVTEGWNHSLYYINMQPRVDNIQSVVGSKEFKESAGRIVSTYWKEYLSQVANKGKSMGQGTFDVILRNLRQNFQVAILGFKATTVLLQPTAGFNAVMTAYAMYGTDTALSIMAELAQAYVVPSYKENALSQSEALTLRAGSAGSADFAEINRLMETGLADLRGNYSKLKAGAVKAGMYMIQEVDIRTASAVRQGMYKALIARGVPETKASADADFFMTLSQSSTQLVDRPLILARYGEFGRLFFTFQTFTLGLWSMITQGLVVNGLIKGTPKVKIKSALALLAIPFFTAFAGEMISIVNNAIKGKDDDEDIEDKLKNAFENTWVELVATVPLFGSIIKGKVLYNRNYEVPLVGTGLELVGGIEGLMSAQDYDDFMKNLMTLGKTSSIFAGIPGAFQATDVINRFVITEKEKKQIETRAIARAYMDAKEVNLDKYVTDLIMKLYTKEEIKNLKSTTKTTLKTNILKEVVRLGKNDEAKNVLKLSKNEEKADYLKEIRDQYTPAEFKQLVNYLKKYKVLSDDAELLIYKK